MALLDFGKVIFGDTADVISWMQSKKLLASRRDCPACQTAMQWQVRADISDGFRWRCPVTTCRKTLSIREGSFFTKSRLTLQQWLLLMHWWMREYPSGQAAEEAKVVADTAGQVYQWLREVCSTKLLATPIQLGGPGGLVQIDESLFRHKPKYHRGRATSHEVWVFGMVDLSQQPALGYMEVVPDRTAATLLPIIQNHTLPNTTIHSDQWQAYSRVGSLTNVNTHATVNHSLHFVDPVTGVHTQNVESYWARVKSKFKKMKGCHESQLPSYLDEFMWRERYGSSGGMCMSNIIGDIAQQYPVP